MTYEPIMTEIAALIGEPSRALMLSALMTGESLTATELATEGGVSKQTASSHLAKMQQTGLLTLEQQGRHRYFRLANSEVAQLLETFITLTSEIGRKRVIPGPKNDAMKKARICYDHLAGQMAVQMYDILVAKGYLELNNQPDAKIPITLSDSGEKFFTHFGIDIASLKSKKRPMCRTCLDWSVRRPHLSGALGAAILTKMLGQNWIVKSTEPRLMTFTPKGELKFKQLFS